MKCICDFYSDPQIDDAKRILIDHCTDGSTRNKKRVGPNKSQKNVQDIISKLNESGESAPSFVAKDLSSVPPLSLDFFDLAKVTRDVGKFMAHAADMSSITTILNCLQEDLRDMCSNIKSVSDDVNVLKSNSSLTTCKSDPVTSDSLVSVPVVRARPTTGSSERTAISSVSSLLMARPAREHAEVIAEPVSAIEPA